MLFVDLSFCYKNTFRYLLLNKLGYVNNHFVISKLAKLILFFSIKKLDDIDQIQLYNVFYLFKFFLGRNAFFTRINKVFTLGNWYYNFNIQLIVNSDKDSMNILFFFFNNIFNNVESNLLKIGILSSKFNIYYFILKDYNVYSELKTNLGLFNIRSQLNMNLYFTGVDIKSSELFVKILRK
jgi:hypothetical protein